MKVFGKINENGVVEPAPRNKDGISNWGLDEEAVKAAGYKEVVDTPCPEGLVQPIKSWQEEEDKIVVVWKEGYQAPEPVEEDATAAHIEAIKESMAELDAQSIRPLRALSAGVGTEQDKAKLEEIESNMTALRKELQELSKEEQSAEEEAA